MNSRMLAKAIAGAALEKKAQDVVVLDLRKLTTFTDFFVVCSGTSDRQVQTIGQSIEDTLRTKKRKPFGVEGYETGHWVLIDYGDVVAHVFYHLNREHYQLEKLWFDAPRIKI